MSQKESKNLDLEFFFDDSDFEVVNGKLVSKEPVKRAATILEKSKKPNLIDLLFD